MHELNEEIGKLLARAEQLGGEGNVEEAQQVLENVERTRALKREAEVLCGLGADVSHQHSRLFKLH